MYALLGSYIEDLVALLEGLYAPVSGPSLSFIKRTHEQPEDSAVMMVINSCNAVRVNTVCLCAILSNMHMSVFVIKYVRAK